MSYIRSGMNPESLYIWRSDEFITMTWRNDPDDDEPELGEVDIEDFYGIIDEYVDEFRELPITFGALTLSEHWNNGEYKINLKFDDYVDKDVSMWTVTWEYVVNDYLERQREDKIWDRFKTGCSLFFWNVTNLFRRKKCEN